ncbi:hypothetical protein D9M72_586800 [compost metagenome]
MPFQRAQQIDLTRVRVVACTDRQFMADERPKASLLEQRAQPVFDASGLFPCLVPPGAQPAQIVDSCRGVVLHGHHPGQLEQVPSHHQHGAFLPAGAQGDITLAQPLGHRAPVAGPEI